MWALSLCWALWDQPSIMSPLCLAPIHALQVPEQIPGSSSGWDLESNFKGHEAGRDSLGAVCQGISKVKGPSGCLPESKAGAEALGPPMLARSSLWPALDLPAILFEDSIWSVRSSPHLQNHILSEYLLKINF